MSTAANDPPNEKRRTNFVNMSAVLTGFMTDVIDPLFDPLGLVAVYLQTADDNAKPATVDSLIQQYVTLLNSGRPNQQIADALLETTNAEPALPALLARAIVTLWYLGSWNTSWNTPPKTLPKFTPAVVSPNAYIGGLAWKAIQAHPMGASDFTFGYWVEPPPPLSNFGVDTANGGKHV